VRALPLRYTVRDHVWMALQGLLLFGANYVLVYLSEAHISSGLTAVIFSSIAFWKHPGHALFLPDAAAPLRSCSPPVWASLGSLSCSHRIDGLFQRESRHPRIDIRIGRQRSRPR